MFEGLDDINWTAIGSHVYGDNETIPQRIHELISEDKVVRTRAADFLLGGGQDIGSIYASTGYIIPFALQVLAEDTPITKHLFLLDSLAAISGGGVYLGGADTVSIRQQRSVLRAYDALVRGENLYLDLLKSTEIEVRLSALELLGGLSESAERLVPMLINHFASETDAEVQKRAVEFTGRLLYRGDYTDSDLRGQYASFFQRVVDSERAAKVRYEAAEWAVRAAISSLWNERLSGGEVSTSVINTLVEWFKDSEAAEYYGRDIIELLSRAGAIEALTTLMNDPQTQIDFVHEIARALLDMAHYGRYLPFGYALLHFPPLHERESEGRFFAFYPAAYKGYILPEVLARLQSIVDCDFFWTIPTNMFSFFFSLPDSREELRALLAKN